MKLFSPINTKILSILFLLLLSPALATALSLDVAKPDGSVGETQSGYVEAVSASPNAEVANLVKEINSKRKKKYQQIAKDTNASLSEVEKLAGEKAIKRTKPGNYVKRSGNWVKK